MTSKIDDSKVLDAKTEMLIQAKKIIDTGCFEDQTNGKFIFSDKYVHNATKSKIMDSTIYATSISSHNGTIECPLTYPEFAEMTEEMKKQSKDNVIFGCSDFQFEIYQGETDKDNDNYIESISFKISDIDPKEVNKQKEQLFTEIYKQTPDSNCKKLTFNMFKDNDVCSIRTAFTTKKIVIKLKNDIPTKVIMTCNCYTVNIKNDLLSGPLIYNFNSVVPIAYGRTYDIFKFPIKNKIPDDDVKYMICYNHRYFRNDDETKATKNITFKRDTDAEKYPEFKIDENNIMIKIKTTDHSTKSIDEIMKGINDDVYTDKNSPIKSDKDGFIIITIKVDKISEIREYLVANKCKVKAEAIKIELEDDDKIKLQNLKTQDLLRLYKLYIILTDEN